MKRLTRRTILAAAPTALAFGSPLLAPWPARAAKQYGPGVTDTEIKIGNTAPYSGPASNYSTIWKCEAAYYQMNQRRRGHQRPQDQFHFLRRCLYAAEDGRDDAQAGRTGPGLRDRRRRRNADEQRDLEIH